MKSVFLRLAVILFVSGGSGWFGAGLRDSAAAEAVEPASQVIRLWGGRDLSPFYTWLKDTKYDDPRRVFRITSDGLLHITGDGLGALVTRQAYGNYHAVLEYRWGETTWHDRQTRTRDSGLLIHSTGADGGYGGTWMPSLEVQIIEGGVGDFILVSGPDEKGQPVPLSITCEVARDRDGEVIWQEGGGRETFNNDNRQRVNWYGRDVDWEDRVGFRGKADVDSPGQEWTRLDVICQGSHVQVYVNGTLVNEAFDVAPSAGRLQLQTELAELFVRRWELWPVGRGPEPAPASGVAASPDRRRPKVLSKEVFVRHDRGRPVATGFVTYISSTQTVLMHCFGREDYSDGYDDYAISVSRDNGRTWSLPAVRWKSEVVPEGRIRYAEPAALYDAEHDKLIVLSDRTLYPNDQLNVDADYGLELNVYDPPSGRWIEQRALEFPGDRTPAMSFSFPLKTRQGTLLFPGMRKVLGPDGKAVHYRDCWAPVDEAVTVMGRWQEQGHIAWQLGRPLTVAPEVSSRGLDENALFELPDGRIAAVCRGDNSMFPERRGHKWLSFSSDEGSSWSAAVPLPASDGEPIESGANGSALFRSVKNGRLYWMGNLALRGERPQGNFPRSPLVLVEVDDRSMELKRDTIFAIDERNFNDSQRVQMSNFRFYQDRENGDLVVFLSRYGEFSEKEWMLADYYRYRVELPDGL